MAFFGGLTHQEIAHQTVMPLGSIKSILRRSMQTLRPLLEQANVSVKESP
jgi:DNA-directed RNA polymerase specialized sigma24 family protein